MIGNLYTLRLQDTLAWPSFGADPANFPEASRISDFLSKNGVVLGGPEGQAVSIRGDGSVYVWAFNDPEFAWQTFRNEPSEKETEYEADIAALRGGVESDNRLLAAISRLLLKALNAEP